jgi:hypothetical protein
MKYARLCRIPFLIWLLAVPAGCSGGSGSNASLISIKVTPANAVLATGSVQQYAALGTYSDSSTRDLTQSVSWSSSSSAVAGVSDAAGTKGALTAIAAGTCTVTASLGTVSGATGLTVTSGVTLASLTVTPADSSVSLGSSVQFAVQGNYSDGSSVDLTATATWSSSAGAVATVSDAAGSKGKATAFSAGTTTISAAVGSLTGSSRLTVTGSGAAAAAGANVMPITVNGSLCSSSTSSGYYNKPCVSVTLCNPDGSGCLTVNDILLDTGSYGLRIFKAAISGLSLSQVASGSGSLAECVQFADGSALWGPVQLAQVQLGSETPVQIPIQVIDASFGSLPRACSGADATPGAAGFTGILGVGVLAQDCGSDCVGSSGNGMYYRCSGTKCSGTAVSLANQVPNPVASLDQDNNGVMVQLPSAIPGGVTALSGSLVLGVGTRANNTATPTVLPADSSGDFSALFQGVTSTSFLDTGSNGLFIPNEDPADLPTCPGTENAWYCPAGTKTLSAIDTGALGSPSVSLSFTVGNFISLTGSSNMVFQELAGTSDFGFDWGLPFFLGRSVFVGLEGTTGLGSTGPYVAF